MDDARFEPAEKPAEKPAEPGLASEEPVEPPAASAQTLCARVKAYDPSADVAKIANAYEFARAAHEGQTRYSGRPYYEHPVAVAEILAELHLDVDTIVTALLHDTVEDTGATLAIVRERYGEDVAGLVDGVTKLSQVSRARGAEVRQAENLQKFVLAISRDIRVLLVKLADRLHNMRTMGFVPKPEKRERISRETMEIYAPLARRVGLHRICGELEDLAFRHTNPAAFESLQRRLAAARAERREAVAEVSGDIARRLAEAGVNARVFGREKRAYSIWRKLERRGIDFEDLADVYGFRVIVEDVDECYHALGLVHRAYRCVPERFKDFISTPKPNGYRSIHTTVIGPDNRRVELQIRTEQMDRIAEDGVAAHWRYKNKTYAYDPELAREAGGDPMERLRALVELLEHGDEPEEFLQHAKLEMFTDQVFAFTPKGDVIALPMGATALDFAYAVHTDVGDTCVGAKINGRRRPLRAALSNGDVVEVIRSASPAPLPGWEDMAVTGRARSSIRRLIRRSEKVEFARIGRAIAEHAFRREGLDLAAAQLEDALNRLEFTDEDSLFAAMGRGRLSGAALLGAVYPGRERAGGEADAPRELIVDEKAPLFVRGRGLTPGVSLHFASCCSPLPGDRIVGILTKDRGVVVHTIDCEALAKYEGEQDRWIDLGWTAEAAHHSLGVGRIIATVENEKGALAEIAGAVGRSNGNITGLRIINRAPDFFQIRFDVEALDARHLSQIIAAMRACPSVVEADRERAPLAEEDAS